MENMRGDECDLSVDTISKGLNWAEIGEKGLHETNEIPNQTQPIKDRNQVGEGEDFLYTRAVEDVSNTGFKMANPDKESWAKGIENKMDK
ncbi:hypothetical protein V6N11_042719 [Hibiscus sabdariffa]|uniref:Uncharacterized protein n=1 Tax=Hibiscus sabdariffa TaxID=183260 RepID=A0ABR2QXA1_9ROSI